MLYKLIQEALSEDNVESLTLNLINNKTVEISNYNKYKSDEYYLYITEPQISIVVLQHVVNVEVNLKSDFDISKLKF
ncbi:hypothetical protein [Staphylococcus warneri]|uniref:hypothetical protein n=1 Tax=Staphylococcus warneri TaxID=1292 RepID=UPI001071E31E|nr:hypothetical protein [Staphylococcus warneri]MBC3135025.1 hypothetical protein [Staphylococcus warneri]MBF0770612.1 hypothetical protein [Staphylococcus warneri]MCE5000551.1 hypothetical protein [Staphylococcus warneri]MCI2747145.1 hypothetical protein [Staphylococcus warneri]MCI2767736.1 hypothetical protein [Staphylococcus warneri]